jgi:hypothetical protein
MEILFHEPGGSFFCIASLLHRKKTNGDGSRKGGEIQQEIQPIIFSYSYVKKAVLKRAAFFCSYGGNTAEISH